MPTFDKRVSFAIRKFDSAWSGGTQRSSPKKTSVRSHGRPSANGGAARRM